MFIWFTWLISFIISLFSFCLDYLSIGESRVLKFPTINVWTLISDLNFSHVSFMNMCALEFGT